MNKLNELAARAMGFSKDDAYACWVRSDRPAMITYKDWSPDEDCNQALELLEKVIGPATWELKHDDCKYMTYEYRQGFNAFEESLPLSMTVCALRAFGIPEQELQEAMRE